MVELDILVVVELGVSLVPLLILVVNEPVPVGAWALLVDNPEELDNTVLDIEHTLPLVAPVYVDLDILDMADKHIAPDTLVPDTQPDDIACCTALVLHTDIQHVLVLVVQALVRGYTEGNHNCYSL